jgi:hypothetical protein
VSRGTYTGPRADLKDHKALLRQKDEDTVLAQFDDSALPADPSLPAASELNNSLGLGWHEFPAKDFEPDPPVSWSDGADA